MFATSTEFTSTEFIRPAGHAPDRGMITAEYAIGTVAAAAFAFVLFEILTGDTVVAAITDLVRQALAGDF